MERKEASAPPLAVSLPPRRSRGFWGDAFRILLKNRLGVAGGVMVLLLALVAILAPWLTPYSYAGLDWRLVNQPPSLAHPLGTDYLGRDVLTRLLYGARISLTVGVVGATLAMLIGIIYGSIAGYYGGKVDNILMRFADLMYGFPTLLLIILIMVFFRSTGTLTAGYDVPLVRAVRHLDDWMGGMLFIFVGIAITNWMTASRLVRGIILSLKEREFIQAAQALGASDLRIIGVHLLPNTLGPIIVAETLNIPSYILLEAFLSFIGLGVNPPTPSWGGMINDGVASMRSYPHQVLAPAGALSLSLLAFNFLGDALRDALEPKMR